MVPDLPPPGGETPVIVAPRPGADELMALGGGPTLRRVSAPKYISDSGNQSYSHLLRK